MFQELLQSVKSVCCYALHNSGFVTFTVMFGVKLCVNLRVMQRLVSKKHRIEQYLKMV